MLFPFHGKLISECNDDSFKNSHCVLPSVDCYPLPLCVTCLLLTSGASWFPWFCSYVDHEWRQMQDKTQAEAHHWLSDRSRRENIHSVLSRLWVKVNHTEISWFFSHILQQSLQLFTMLHNTSFHHKRAITHLKIKHILKLKKFINQCITVSKMIFFLLIIT